MKQREIMRRRKNCAENEVIAGKGDNKYLPSEYDKRMRMKLIAGK